MRATNARGGSCAPRARAAAACGLAAAVVAACTDNATPPPEPVPELAGCVPDRDGAITAAELPLALGSTAPFYTGDNRTIVQTGTDWDFSEERADDRVIALGPVPLHAQWYAASFPAGQFVVDAGGELDGIYHQDDQGLWLDGIASRVETPRTLIAYSPPLAVLRFPLAAGATYTSTAPLAGATIAGLPFNGSDELAIDVAGAGVLAVPYVEFSPVLRVRLHAIRRPSSGGMTSRRTTIFLFECFGEVTRAESRPDEPSPDFTSAASLRRFALGARAEKGMTR